MSEIFDSVDMRSSLGQELDYYEKRNYKPESAIAEFVDNSVASYLWNKVLLKTIDPFFKLKIDIKYDFAWETLEVIDNAGGMDRQTFKNALILGRKPKDNSGLNEFGWGLKTAASWFGKKWSVTSTFYDSNEEIYALVDIRDLVKTGSNDVPITVKNVEKRTHYTKVKIWNLTKTITKCNVEKLKESLASIYRRFIAKDEIEIFFNGVKLTYEEPEVLTTIEDGVETKWKKEFTDEVEYCGKTYPISGFVALLKDGKYNRTGFTLIRRNRVIIGGLDKGYKPTEIFKNANSFQSLRLFGEVNLNDWPVTQSKDNFDWDLNGLEDAFIEKMKSICQRYIQKASTYRAKEKKNPVTVTKVQEIADETKRNIEAMEPTAEVTITKELPPIEVKKNTDGLEIPTITYPLSICGTDYTIHVEFVCDQELDLVSVEHLNSDHTDITVRFNSVFPMFYELRSNSTFIKVLQKFFVAYVIAEEQTLRISDDGSNVNPNILRDNLNNILVQMSNSGDFTDE